MIKIFTAFTQEVDDANAAVAEITQSLAFEGKLLKNSVGIISCYSEFVETGVLKAICDSLPFDCIGSTTCLSATCDVADSFLFAITVLTSDDCDFKAMSIPIENFENQIPSVLNKVCEKEKPSLLLVNIPLLNVAGMPSGDVLMNTIDKVTNGIPMFGTISVDHTPNYSTNAVMHNGEAFTDKIVLCAISGNVNFAFEVASINSDKIIQKKSVITKSDGNILHGVDGKNAFEFLTEIGLSKEDLDLGLGLVPFIVDHKDGTIPIARATYSLTPDGSAVCGGAMQQGALLTVGHISRDDVISTTVNTLPLITKEDGLVLIYSCIGRFFTLGSDFLVEPQKIIEHMNGRNFMYAQSGGEFCPLPDADGKLKNYFHNYSIIFCRIS